MKWKNISFNRKSIAEGCKEEIAKAGIKVGDIFSNDGYWILPWMPMSRDEYNTGLNIIFKYTF